MKVQIQCERDDFLKAIQSVSSALNSKVLPILTSVLLKAGDGKVSLTATNLETTIRSSFAARMKGKTKICFPGGKVLSILRELPSGELDVFVMDKNVLLIKYKKSKFRIMCISTEEFPETPEKMVKEGFSFNLNELKNVIRKTVFCSGKDEHSTHINGVYFEGDGKKIEVVATDGRRMAIAKVKIAGFKGNVLIPLKAARALDSLLVGDNDEFVKIGIDDNRIFFEIRDTLLVAQLSESKFPDYKKIIPEKSEISMVTDRVKLMAGIRRVSILTGDTRIIRLDLHENVLTISAEEAELGGAEEEIKVKSKDNLVIGVNSNYILEALKGSDEESIKMEFVDSERPIVIKPNKDYIYVIMPMRLG